MQTNHSKNNAQVAESSNDFNAISNAKSSPKNANNSADFAEQSPNDFAKDFAPKSHFSHLSHIAQIAFLSVFWVGKCKKASGTMGSIAGVALGLPVLYFSSQTLFLLAVFVALLAIKQVNVYEAQNAHKEGFCHDESWIVIDEVVGVWIALSIACFDKISIIGVASAFVLFRVFDIWKPSLIGKIDKEAKGGLGVVGDDALAGLVAGLASLVVIEGFRLFVGLESYFVGL